ncbi:hypothetical protein [Psychrosphaera algicola]|uniref:Uncharacterized protein n=1 Tax=Psychrosphaera algicola TaxID=3023714 RepID=A0ABT5FJL5_9GAMM|nr:hypothetical protein [Psychrosphaera sp. G1-22]MDC2891340.1 hypothetical protein [Psychrosphaera sp. G1-22]
MYDLSKYNPESKTWLTKSSLFFGPTKSFKPTSFEAYQLFKEEFLTVSYDKEIGVLSISVKHYSPKVAFITTNLMATDINDYFKTEDQREARANIEFIEDKLNSTSNTLMLEVFYKMIESHSQTLMLTEVNNQYLVKTLIPAKLPEKSRP